PRSSITTRKPRSVSTLAAAAPEAPAPMTQTSARSGLVSGAMLVLPSRIASPVAEPVQDAVPPGVHLGQRFWTRESDHLPADPVLVAAVDRVGVEALPGVEGQQRDELHRGLGAGLLERRLHRCEAGDGPRLLQVHLGLSRGL